MTQDLQDKAIKIKGKEYVQVKDRIIYLSEEVKDYSIETSYDYYPERKLWVVKATLTVGNNKYTGLAQEIESDNYKEVNHSSALENCETSAVGRACAMAGIGVIDSIASVDEINKANNRPISSQQGLNLLRSKIAKLADGKTLTTEETLKIIQDKSGIALKDIKELTEPMAKNILSFWL